MSVFFTFYVFDKDNFRFEISLGGWYFCYFTFFHNFWFLILYFSHFKPPLFSLLYVITYFTIFCNLSKSIFLFCKPYNDLHEKIRLWVFSVLMCLKFKNMAYKWHDFVQQIPKNFNVCFSAFNISCIYTKQSIITLSLFLFTHYAESNSMIQKLYSVGENTRFANFNQLKPY